MTGGGRNRGAKLIEQIGQSDGLLAGDPELWGRCRLEVYGLEWKQGGRGLSLLKRWKSAFVAVDTRGNGSTGKERAIALGRRA